MPMYSLGEKKAQTEGASRPGRCPSSLLMKPGAKRDADDHGLESSGAVPIASLLKPLISKNQQKKLNRKARKAEVEDKEKDDDQTMNEYIFQNIIFQ